VREEFDPRAYARGQFWSLGSGLLGGWSGVALGGSFGAAHPDREEEELRTELRAALRRPSVYLLPDAAARR
jgi:hypothetical protein